MCGIAGLVSLTAPRAAAGAPAAVQRMLDALAHRGPDGEGIATVDRAVLGHRRLAIIDLVGGAQPMASPSGRVTLVFNGEIYNFRPLREELTARGHHFVTASDSEVLAAALDEWSIDCLARLRGMFAFAAWDGARQQLLLGRDRLGKKPLYWAIRDGILGFASDLSALFAWGAIEPTLDARALAAYLRDGYVAAPATMLAGVHKLAAGSVAQLTPGGLQRVHSYWDVHYDEKLHDKDATRRQLAQLLDEAIADRLISDVPVGAFLSSGLDSSLVVTRAATMSPGLSTFTVGFDHAGELDERAGARVVAALAKSDHHESCVALDAVATLPEVVRRLGEPIADPSALPTFVVASLAREKVKVVLTGDGGDETFAGYSRYVRSRLSFAWARLPAPMRAVAVRALRLAGVRADRLHDAETRAAKSAGAAYADAMHTFDVESTRRLVHGDHRAPVDAALARDPLVTLFDHAPAHEWLDRLLYTDLKSYLAENVLVKVDRMTMAHGIEARSPLLDHRLVELAARMPVSWKRGAAGGKQILRELAYELLPTAVVERKKLGFDLPVHTWMRKGALRAAVERDLGASELVRDGWLDGAAVAAQLGPDDDGQAPIGNRLWSLYVLELWYRQLRATATAAVGAVAVAP